MRRPLAIAILSLLVPLASARAEDAPAPTYPLDTWTETWKVGDVASTREESVFTASFRMDFVNPETGKAETEEQQSSKVETALLVEKCLAVDAKGQRTKYLVHVAEWKVTEDGGEPDESLKGTHVEVTVTDGVHAWRLLTPGAKPTEGATDWLDTTYGKEKSKEDLDELGRPAGPVKVGDSWKGDPLALDFPFPIKKDTSSVGLELVSVNDGTFRVAIKFRLQLDGFPLGETGVSLPFTDGGVFEGEGEVRHALAAHAGGGGFKGKLQGTASKKGLATVKLSVEAAVEGVVTEGGEMPPAPAPKPAEPAGAPK